MNKIAEASVQNALSGMTTGPAPLIGAIAFYARPTAKGDNIAGELAARVCSSPNDEVRKLLNRSLGEWDWEANASWTAATEPNTRARRDRIYELLSLGAPLRKTLDEHIPPYEGAKAVVIDDPATIGDWYTFDFRAKHNFYWKRLRAFLERTRDFKPEAINSIASSADRILEHLGDPASIDIYRSRGLVVGYVQSGKTTNFTAVIAKAIDAGYRLIIVLSGTTNLLRNQTQRRLDMELVGVENIVRGANELDLEHDYIDDERWPASFISYGRLPSLLGHVDIHRLTTQEDFKSQQAGLNPLEFDFEKRDKKRPLFDRENLDHAGARVAVVKKQRDRLNALIKELKSVGTSRCAEVPTLIIDDESDQASVNTVDPDKVTDKTRSSINGQIVEVMRRLPRSQYLGYTATPFANVFVNPNDPEDIYPKDFIVSLQRPDGYMGAQEFLDFAAPKPGTLSNYQAHIRDIPKVADPHNDRLLEAIDAFVLSGAIKKYRQERSDMKFKHHTMLVHHSVRKDDQEQVVATIEDVWKKGGYDSPGSATGRLEKLFDDDFRKVWVDRGQPAGLGFPMRFAELRAPLGQALDEIRRGGSPVLMVNSAEGAQVPDFDSRVGVWKIIVGGAKLSRGYTIEGLTISYFRRRAKMQDTLMQMGRWFGYRPGFKDLVRLYIGRQEQDGKKTIDLYRAFEAMCRDEEEFRAQLEMYQGKGGITPREVPALVFNSHPSLRPTSRNKMFNARITWAAFDYREPTTQAAGSDGREKNAALFQKLLSATRISEIKVRTTKSRGTGVAMKWAKVPHPDMLSVLKKVQWEKTGNPISAELAFLGLEDTPVKSWILLAPQVQSTAGSWQVAGGLFQCIARTRAASSTRYGVFSSPEHVIYAKWLVGGPDNGFASALKPEKGTAILLFYPTRELLPGDKEVSPGVPVMGFAMVLPSINRATRRIAYSVRIN